MKTTRIISLSMVLFLIIGNIFAQDDFYPSDNSKDKDVEITPVENKVLDEEYSTASDYYKKTKEEEAQARYNEQMGLTDSTTYYEDENGDVRVTNNYFNGDNYDYANEYYDYEYTSRIKRFHRPYSRYGYYDDCYTNYYWYDYNPYNYGVSVYTSYGWWNPRPWNWSFGWSWNTGWYAGWSWGWGFNNYGYYGNSYWNGYNHGFYNGYYANNYYNSFDRNSHYYGHRGGRSGALGYGKGTRPSGSSIASNYAHKPKVVKNKTFGEKYEAAIKNDRLNTNSVKPRLTNINNGIKTKPRTANSGVKTGPRVNSSPRIEPRTSTVKNAYTKPRNSANTYSKPRTNPYQNSNKPRNNVNYNKPRYDSEGSGGKPRYNTPKSINQNGYGNPRNTTTKGPRTYSKPKTRPAYNKPKTSQNYSRPSRSYSKPSGGNYNRGNSGRSGSSGRRPR